MTTLQLIERQLMHQSKRSDDGALLPAIGKLQSLIDGEVAAAVAKTEARMNVQIEQLKRQIEQQQLQLQAAQRELHAAHERAQNEVSSKQSMHETEMQARRKEHEASMRKTMQGHEDAMQALRKELDRERAARIQAETKHGAAQDMHTAMGTILSEIKKVKPAAPVVVQPAQVKGVTYTFEIRRRGDGLITEVIAKPMS